MNLKDVKVGSWYAVTSNGDRYLFRADIIGRDTVEGVILFTNPHPWICSPQNLDQLTDAEKARVPA